MLNLVLEYRDEAQSIAAWVVCFVAIVWGAGPERAIAATWLVLFKFLDNAYHAIWEISFKLDGLDIFHAANDLLALACFIGIALFANRIYTLWLASFQILAVLAHVTRELADQVTPIAYVILAVSPGYFQLILFALGIGFHIRRTKRFGTYRDWRLQAPKPAWLDLGQGKRQGL